MIPQKLLDTLPNTGCYIVGGYLRDEILGRQPEDIDIAVEGDRKDVESITWGLSEVFGVDYKFNDQFGTAIIYSQPRIELAMCRTETYPKPGCNPKIQRTVYIKEDLKRRDFTMNTLARRIDDGKLGLDIDPYDGYLDIIEHKIRVLHPHSFIDDPTRIKRAIEYSERLGFTIEPNTLELMIGAIENGCIQTVKRWEIREAIEASVQAWDRHRAYYL